MGTKLTDTTASSRRLGKRKEVHTRRLSFAWFILLWGLLASVWATDTRDDKNNFQHEVYRRCDLSKSPFFAVSYNKSIIFSALDRQKFEDNHTTLLRRALVTCNEIIIPAHLTLLTGPFNLTSHQVLTVDGTLMASSNRSRFPFVAPVLGYGWSNDQNCFLPSQSRNKIVVGALRYAPVIGSFYSQNITIRGTGVIDGSGWDWWDNCTICHSESRHTVNSQSPLQTNESFCLPASRPKLVEMQFVTGFSIHGGHDRYSGTSSPPLTLANSPFWTITPHYSQDIFVSNLHIVAPGRVGNTDGCNLDSCRNAILQHLYIANGDDGIALKSGLNGFGLNLAIPTENVWIDNVTTTSEGRGGLAIGSEMSGGIRNVTFRNCRLLGERGIIFKPSVGRGGYIDNIMFQSIASPNKVKFYVGHDGIPLMPNNSYVPLVSNIRFENVSHVDLVHGFSACFQANQSKCFNITSDDGQQSPWKELLPSPRHFSCKTHAKTMYEGTITLPWPVCIPLDSPVNLRPDYPNWGPTKGIYSSLQDCQVACKLDSSHHPPILDAS
ncbi:glycoside hydrolase family 28 domain containing protein [Nitzschia inconspicua]|uniref:Glycoside hydrolase family 28 domain containing protein n=1 Tax=Nitzschia inconspicua TaxID=303405 RepID=A0A9K3PS20_9STRA|nr:glycoside hydrolase family 28 domain containing protein [Nitzschia inconspicua]